VKAGIRTFLLGCSITIAGLPSLSASQPLAEVREQGQAEARSALSELRQFRLQMQEEQLPMERTIRSLRSELEASRLELRRLREAADSSEMALSDLEKQVDRLALTSSTVEALVNDLLTEQSTASGNQLDPVFAENFEAWESAGEGSTQIRAARALLSELIADLTAAIGGRVAPLTLYSQEGKRIEGRGIFLGPLVFFSGGGATGMVDRSDPSYPQLSPSPAREALAIRTVLDDFTGLLPIDATGGAALAIRKNAPDLLGEILRAGIWIYPILFAAAVASVVALVKWIGLFRTRRAVQRGRKHFAAILAERDGQRYEPFLQRQPRVLQPFWKTLHATRHLAPASREDLLYARLIEIRLRLTRGLAALSVIAATTPLLGLLGTVTGMITTFQRITLFGTGDPQNLSGGISEALLTTKFGLIVAIPTFLIYAYLSRRAQGTVADLENFSEQLNSPSNGEQPTH